MNKELYVNCQTELNKIKELIYSNDYREDTANNRVNFRKELLKRITSAQKTLNSLKKDVEIINNKNLKERVDKIHEILKLIYIASNNKLDDRDEITLAQVLIELKPYVDETITIFNKSFSYAIYSKKA